MYSPWEVAGDSACELAWRFILGVFFNSDPEAEEELVQAVEPLPATALVRVDTPLEEPPVVGIDL